MWLKEKEFRIRLGSTTFIDVPNLVTFNGKPMFVVRRHEDTGQVAIDCDVYNADGFKIASVRRNMIYFGEQDAYELDHSGDRITLRNKQSGDVIADIKKRGEALPVELDVSLRTYLPDGRLINYGFEQTEIGSNVYKDNTIKGGNVGFAFNNPAFHMDREFIGETVKLDGQRFYDCSFKECVIVYEEKLPFQTNGCKLINCTWRFEGAAKLMVDALCYLHGTGYKELVEKLFDIIRGTATPSKTP
jgi:hypothetical protein